LYAGQFNTRHGCHTNGISELTGFGLQGGDNGNGDDGDK